MSSVEPLVSGGWRPTASFVRAALLSTALAAISVGTGRADLLVLAAPFLVHTVAAVSTRPGRSPRVASSRLGHTSVREGEGTTVEVTLADCEDVEHAVVSLARGSYTSMQPASGVVGTSEALPGERIAMSVDVASLRWGRRGVGEGVVAATDPWAARRWGPVRLLPGMLTTLPLPGAFDSRAPVPHPVGLVGTHPARRTGDGSEFASIRRFQPGDRLRRVHWRVSLRTRELHVTSTVAEEDSSVLLLVDSGVDIGISEGIRGAASTLDVSVRAAGALAEHYLHQGDRVGLRVLGSTERNAVAVGGGRRHLRRVLDTLARITPGEHHDVATGRMRFRVPAGAVVVVLSPMLSEHAVGATVGLARSGITVVVVDTLPAGLVGDVSAEALGGEAGDRRQTVAWRMRLIERDHLLARVTRVGVPVVAWQGPGTLDSVLRGLGRRLRSPRTVAR
ncbi:MAG: DUF58 domain-containing protein [Nocardioides sp.]